jgi:protocatechuate 3,4-dioxygenase beta subunit
LIASFAPPLAWRSVMESRNAWTSSWFGHEEGPAMKMLVVFALAAAAAVTGAAQQSRDAASPRTGVCGLTGQVQLADPPGEEHRPLRRAVVTAYPTADTRARRLTVTDDEGRFSVTELPCSNVVVFASKAGYVTSYFGATTPGSTTGVAVALSERSQAPELVLRVSKGAVITGLVTDEHGRPAARILVRLRQVVTLSTGERTFAVVALGALQPTTDDLGRYRIFGLAPGSYVVSAQRPLEFGAATEMRETSDAELRWAEAQARTGGASGAAPVVPPRGRAVTPALVHYPGTVDQAAADVVTVTAGQERGGIDIALQLVPTARLEGRVIDAEGRPAADVAVVMLSQTGDAIDVGRQTELLALGLGSGTASTRSQADGRFSFPVLQPGQYVLTARHLAAPQPSSWAHADVAVAGEDISGITLQLAPGVPVSGRFVFEGQREIGAATRVALGLRPVGASGASVSASIPLAGPDNPFSVLGVVPSSYRLTATLASWTLKSAMLNGKDVADTPFAVAPGAAADIVVTFTDAPAEVSGVLYDAAKRPASDLFVILFPVDRSLWFQGSRRMKAPARPATDGRYVFAGLPAGEYYLAALTEAAPGEWSSVRFLESIVPSALKVVVADGEKKVQDLQIAK